MGLISTLILNEEFLQLKGEVQISLKTISSEKDVLDWAHHICEKTWMTVPVLRRFIEVAVRESGLKLH